MSKFDDFLKRVFNTASFGAEDLARQFETQHDFLGTHNGPADAARHTSRAAYLAYKSNDTYAEMLLDARESLGGTTNSDMDYYNNAIGIQIGAHLRDNNVAIEEIDSLVEKLITESMSRENWITLSSGIMISEDSSPIQLRENLVVSSIAVMPEAEWRAHKGSKSNELEQHASSAPQLTPITPDSI